MRKIIITILLMIMNSSAQGGIEKLIKNVMPSGTMSNVTNASIANEQEAGHLMGGSVIIKTPAASGMQLISAKGPSCAMGGLPCGASFEFLGGGVSIVSSAELMRHLKGLAQNAATYGGMMAIKTLCPQCEDLMSWLDSKADWLNNLAKTDCEDMARLAGGMLGKVTSGSRATRQSALILNGDGKDMADFARKSKRETRDPTDSNPELENMLGDNYNLVWKALGKKLPRSGENNSIKELLMSISGTIINKKDGRGRRSAVHKISLINKEMIEEFIGGKGVEDSKEIDLYICDETTKCLNPRIAPARIEVKDSLMGRIRDLVNSITQKIKNDQGPFDDDENTLIATSSLSLITKIELDLANYGSLANTVIAQEEFIEALSFDVVTNYLAKLLQEVQFATKELGNIQIADSGIFSKFDLEIREVMRSLARAKNTAFKRYDLISATRSRIKQEVKYFEFQFEEYCSLQNK